MRPTAPAMGWLALRGGKLPNHRRADQRRRILRELACRRRCGRQQDPGIQRCTYTASSIEICRVDDRGMSSAGSRVEAERPVALNARRILPHLSRAARGATAVRSRTGLGDRSALRRCHEITSAVLLLPLRSYLVMTKTASGIQLMQHSSPSLMITTSAPSTLTRIGISPARPITSALSP
ncbi:Hypothetical protein NGAL_HAMBI490_14570 [Neorhizobium galegae bv. officinalis]|nr:Hypothetical protein NGAL_HAMBI490_14570 [Neorhizobium galegae bv. officinalis]